MLNSNDIIFVKKEKRGRHKTSSLSKNAEIYELWISGKSIIKISAETGYSSNHICHIISLFLPLNKGIESVVIIRQSKINEDVKKQ